MKNPRLIYRVILKILALSAFLLLLWVMTRSLFVGSNLSVPENSKQQAQLITIDISAMRKGEIKKARWQDKEIAVLYRKTPIEQLAQTATQPMQAINKSASRSFKSDYFVYIDKGDSGNCPLFYSNETFKDICSSTLFDSAGRKINARTNHALIKIPPHYFAGESLVVGKWLNASGL